MTLTGRKPFLSTTQTVFLASMIAADFGFGLVVKNLLSPTHILSIVRVDMIVPIMLMLITRKIVDRFGILILYEGVWGLFSVFAMPAAFGLPGFLKLIPALSQGIILDSLMSLLRRYHRTRFFISAIWGGFLSSVAFFGLRLALGYPWVRVVQLLFGIRMLTGLLVWACGATLALSVWEKIKDTQMVRRIVYAGGD
ncbi:hypothetical protein DRP98_06415 [candidate division KSB1 bacterium]|nr:MAG: hypothetical protein DRP98_06415 [candidate division KSB1 bacterium]